MDSTASMPVFGPEEQNAKAMEPLEKPVVHFFKACRSYNGCIQYDKEEYHREKGIHSTSSLSGAQASTEAMVEVDPNKVLVRINSIGTPERANREERELLDNDRSDPPLALEAGVGHVVVDPDNDLICYSSFGNDWYPDEFFSGGNAHRQGAPADRARRIGLGLPPLTRKGYVVDCKDCEDTTDETHDGLEWRAHPPHYCAVCVGHWVCYFPNVEQVFLIVPGLPKAEPGDEVLVCRFGKGDVVEEILKATEHSDRDDRFSSRDAGGTSLLGVDTTENFGSDGPSRCFQGNGITLSEARAWDIDDDENQPAYELFLQTLFTEFGASRRCVSEQEKGTTPYERGPESFPAYPPPGTTKIAGGVIEFRVLTDQL